MEAMTVRSCDLVGSLRSLQLQIHGTPLYRPLTARNLPTYKIGETLMPYEEVDLLFSGVIFYFDPACVNRQAEIVVVSSLEKLSKGRKVVDTRNPGYETEFKEQLEREKGTGQFSCWDIWQRVTQNDTIATKGPVTPENPRCLEIYVARLPVTREDLFFDVKVE